MTLPTKKILQIDNLSIQRGEFILCNDVSFHIDSGQVCHLVGKNGSGKTTLLMQLAGMLPIYQERTYQELKNDCNVQFCGSNTLPIQPVYVSHQLSINTNLTVAQNLQFLLSLYGIKPTQSQIINALAWVELQGYEQVLCNQLSAGQMRRVNLARLWLLDTKHSLLWLLDEPFTALDIDMVAKLQTKIRAFADDGGAVLMTSHQIDNMDNVADNIVDLSDFIISNIQQ